MTNEEYLKKEKEYRDNEIEEFKTAESNLNIEMAKLKLRKIYALEIIAETLITISKNLDRVTTHTDRGYDCIRVI